MEVLADDILDGVVGAVRHVADEHVQTYRLLLARRQGEALLSGPVLRALGVLAEGEHELGNTDGEYRIQRGVLHEMRTRILAELAADRALAMPVSA